MGFAVVYLMCKLFRCQRIWQKKHSGSVCVAGAVALAAAGVQSAVGHWCFVAPLIAPSFLCFWGKAYLLVSQSALVWYVSIGFGRLGYVFGQFNITALVWLPPHKTYVLVCFTCNKCGGGFDSSNVRSPMGLKLSDQAAF